MTRRTLPLFSSLCIGFAIAAGAAGVPTSNAATGVVLRWTAPGDDGMSGRATSYELRVSQSPITLANFMSASLVSGVPEPAPAGTRESFTVGGLTPAVTYYFAIRSWDDSGNPSQISNTAVRAAGNVDASDQAMVLAFSAPLPNPAASSTRFEYALPNAADMRVDLYDVSGRRVRTLAEGIRPAGRADLTWDLRDGDGRPVNPGIYLVRAKLADKTWTHRVTVVH